MDEKLNVSLKGKKKSISWLTSTYCQTISAESPDTKAEKEINDFFFLEKLRDMAGMEKQSCREVDIPFPYLGFVFLVVVVVNCIIRLLYSLKIWLSLYIERRPSQPCWRASPF